MPKSAHLTTLLLLEKPSAIGTDFYWKSLRSSVQILAIRTASLEHYQRHNQNSSGSLVPRNMNVTENDGAGKERKVDERKEIQNWAKIETGSLFMRVAYLVVSKTCS